MITKKDSSKKSSPEYQYRKMILNSVYGQFTNFADKTWNNLPNWMVRKYKIQKILDKIN